MWDQGDHWEYVGTYVDDLAIASKSPMELMNKLEKEYGFGLKGTGPISYHLGCDFIRDKSGILCIQPKKYIEKMVGTYERLFGSKPKDVYTSPLEKGDHPEKDTSELHWYPTVPVNGWSNAMGCLHWKVEHHDRHHDPFKFSSCSSSWTS